MNSSNDNASVERPGRRSDARAPSDRRALSSQAAVGWKGGHRTARKPPSGREGTDREESADADPGGNRLIRRAPSDQEDNEETQSPVMRQTATKVQMFGKKQSGLSKSSKSNSAPSPLLLKEGPSANN